MGSHKRKRSEEGPVLTSCDWVRGRLLGKGGYGTVYLGSLKKKPKLSETFPSTMAVKSAVISRDIELRREKFLLDLFSDCPFVIDCYGDDDSSVDRCGNMMYDVFLEYAKGGSLGDLITESGKFGLPETLVRKYTQQILKGLKFIHGKRYVHCDLKPENILLVGGVSNSNSSCDFVPKIADFGLTKKAMRKGSRTGTPKYMAPETVRFEVQEQYSDIWALGCIVVKMLTGRDLWNVKPSTKLNDLLNIIASQEPHIPTGLSKDATDFLVNCLHRYPSDRLTASELLKHPFIECELCNFYGIQVQSFPWPAFNPLGSCSVQADVDVEEGALNLRTQSTPAVIPNSTPPARSPIDSGPPVRFWACELFGCALKVGLDKQPTDSRPPARDWECELFGCPLEVGLDKQPTDSKPSVRDWGCELFRCPLEVDLNKQPIDSRPPARGCPSELLDCALEFSLDKQPIDSRPFVKDWDCELFRCPLEVDLNKQPIDSRPPARGWPSELLDYALEFSLVKLPIDSRPFVRDWDCELFRCPLEVDLNKQPTDSRPPARGWPFELLDYALEFSLVKLPIDSRPFVRDWDCELFRCPLEVDLNKQPIDSRSWVGDLESALFGWHLKVDLNKQPIDSRPSVRDSECELFGCPLEVA